jgi:hypothetical protein
MSADDTGEGSAAYRSLVRDPTLLAMMLVAFVVMFGYEVPAPILPRIAEGVGVSDARIGLVMTAFAVPGMLFVPVTGLLADLYGRRRVLVPSLVLFGAAGLATVAVGDFRTLLGLRALQGLAFAGILPISVVVLGDAFEAADGSAAQGFRTSAAGGHGGSAGRRAPRRLRLERPLPPVRPRVPRRGGRRSGRPRDRCGARDRYRRLGGAPGVCDRRVGRTRRLSSGPSSPSAGSSPSPSSGEPSSPPTSSPSSSSPGDRSQAL